MKLHEISLLDVIPSNMRSDKNIRGFAAAWDHMQSFLLERSRLVNLFESLDLLSGRQLDDVAAAIDIPWYDTSFDIAKKRRIIRNYFPIYCRAGTVWAIEEAMGNIFGQAAVKEWYDYGGQEFHFKVIVTEMESEEKVRMAVRTVDRIRPARTTLDGIEKLSTLTGSLSAGCFIRHGFRTVRHRPPKDFNPAPALHVMALAGHLSRQSFRTVRHPAPDWGCAPPMLRGTINTAHLSRQASRAVTHKAPGMEG